MSGKSKERLIYDSEFVGPERYIRVPNNKGIFIPDNPNLNIRQIISRLKWGSLVGYKTATSTDY
jgi:hypothetical protein